MNPLFSEYWKLLDSFEDYTRYGVRRNHPAPPDFSPLPDGESYPVETPAASAAPADDSLEKISSEVLSCSRCKLCGGRTKAVPGEGSSRPVVLVVGEGPGRDEDLSGRPFVGPAGQYLDKWLAAIGLSRETNCFIANIVKCRPPGNRDPEPDESRSCLSFLNRQIALLKPRYILAVGRISSQILTGEPLGIGKIRGRIYSYREIPLVATYHPSGVLRNQQEYRPLVWEDLKLLKSLMDKRGA